MLSFPTQSWSRLPLQKTKSLPGSWGAERGRYRRAASRISSRLYLSDLLIAEDANELKRLGITHVVSVVELQPDIPETIPLEHRLHIPIADKSDVDILSHMETTTAFIGAALSANEANIVLVHCVQGISRSATIVCAYLVATKRMQGPQAIEYTQSKRGIVCPNLGFRHQLDIYAMQFGAEPVKRRNLGFFKLGGNLLDRLKPKGGPLETTSDADESSAVKA
ncbi:phosphatases II [Pluteus cervinus]|uniref:Phosphatases II n=1 Tax=Pluteus cervinus TaxID=181527 RepID=A0ACD3BA16_9AGAR|nr:phosphatases II [Pluteus cervinus]